MSTQSAPAHAKAPLTWRVSATGAGRLDASVCDQAAIGRCLILRCGGDRMTLSVTGVVAFVDDRARQGRVTIDGVSWFAWFVPETLSLTRAGWSLDLARPNADQIMQTLENADAVSIDLGDGDAPASFNAAYPGAVLREVAKSCGPR